MKIGIDCRTILNPMFGERVGVGHYTYYLLINLLKIDKVNKYVLFFDDLLNHEVVDRIVGKNKNVKVKFFPFHEYRHHLLPDYSKYLINSFVLQEDLDLLHLPSPLLYFEYPRKLVITVRDLSLFHHPEWFEKYEREDVKIIKKAIQDTDKIISVSEFIKKDIIDTFKTKEEKIKVIYNGVETSRHFILTEDVFLADDVIDLEDLRKKYKIGEKYILSLGTIEPRKNILKIIEVFKNLKKEYSESMEEFELVIAGIPSAKSQKIIEEIEKQSNGKIKYLGYVSHNDKFPLIKYASCLINLSLYEGFSLQILEAMKIGTPLIISDKTSFPEIAGKSALLVNPTNTEEISNAFNKVLFDKNIKETLIKEGLKRVKSFDWEKTAQKTLDFYKEV